MVRAVDDASAAGRGAPRWFAMDHARLQRIAARHGGLFTRDQARACGFSPKQLLGRVGRGEWVQVLGRVFTATAGPLTPATRDRAAQLAVSNSILAGPSAARAWGMRVPAVPPCLVVPPGSHPYVTGIRFLRTTLGRREVVLGQGSLPMTNRERTVYDCLYLLPRDDAMTLLDRALQQGWMTLDELAARVRDHRGRPGARQLVELLTSARVGTRSEAERVLVGLLRRAGIDGWVANAAILDGVVGDVVFARQRVVVEVDGWAYHSQSGDFERDRRRQNRLVLAGWTVLRFTWRDLTEAPERVLRTIRAALVR